MREKLLAGTLTVVASIVFCLGFSPPAQAQDPFTITLTKSSPNVCESTGDTSLPCNVDSAAGAWSFSVTVHGRVRYLQLYIKNNPGTGDICFGTTVSNPSGTFVVPTPSEPAAAPNACGDVFNGGLDTNGEPLTVVAVIKTPDASASVTIAVTYPAETAALSGSKFRLAVLGGFRSHQPAVGREIVAIPEKRRA